MIATISELGVAVTAGAIYGLISLAELAVKRDNEHDSDAASVKVAGSEATNINVS